MRKFSVTVSLGERTLLDSMHCWTDSEEEARQSGIDWAIGHLTRQRFATWTPELVIQRVTVSVVDTGQRSN